MSDENWANDKVQFARLLCEIVANQDNIDFPGLCASMDLEMENIHELLERAHHVWEESKARTSGAPLRAILYGEPVEGTSPQKYLVHLQCGHKKYVLEKHGEYPCLECKEKKQ